MFGRVRSLSFHRSAQSPVSVRERRLCDAPLSRSEVFLKKKKLFFLSNIKFFLTKRAGENLTRFRVIIKKKKISQNTGDFLTNNFRIREVIIIFKILFLSDFKKKF